jgi:MscS family membrane protein
VLDNTRIDLSTLSDEPDGAREPGLRPGRQTVSRVDTGNATVSILLERVPREDGVLIWLFSAETLKRIPDLYWAFSYGVVGAWLPPVFVETRLFGLALWQWIGFLVLAGLAYLIARLAIRPSIPISRRILKLAGLEFEDGYQQAPVAPLRTLVALGIFRLGQPLLSLPLVIDPVVSGVQKFILVLVLMWLALQLSTLMFAAARRRALVRGTSPTVLDLVQRALRMTIAVLGILLLFEAVGVPVTTLLAAVGVGGIGIALAAQRTVENLFGGLVVIGDQPIRVGDFCRIGDRQGTVERVGLWSTRIRTLERSVISVPNAQFFTLHVDNMQRRDRLLYNPTLRLRYETTPEQLRRVLSGIRDTIRAHPKIDPNPQRVRFAGFGRDGLEVEIFVYFRSTDYEEFVAFREDLSLAIMDLVAAAGTAFASMQQTVLLSPDRSSAGAVDGGGSTEALSPARDQSRERGTAGETR